jgi:hypothetical protein
MAVDPDGAETTNDCTGEGQQQFTRLDWTTSAPKMVSAVWV